ncbi:transcription factor, MADS-box [Tanacetum coccineum]
MARNETEARRYKTLAMVKLEQRSYASALSYLKKARRNYNKLDALDNLEAVILVRSGEEQGRQDSLCGPWATSATERLNDAYNTLLDADAKEEYDRNVPTTRTATGGGIACWNTAPSDVKARKQGLRLGPEPIKLRTAHCSIQPLVIDEKKSPTGLIKFWCDVLQALVVKYNARQGGPATGVWISRFGTTAPSEVKAKTRDGAIDTETAQVDLLIDADSEAKNGKERDRSEEIQNPSHEAVILRVTPKAINLEIKKAYRKIILLVHPDKCLEFPHAATSATERLNDAYNTLLDADVKEEYDRNVPTNCWFPCFTQ